MKTTKDSVVCRTRDGVAVVAFRYEQVVTPAEANQVMEDLESIAEVEPLTEMILDCSQLKFVTSVFLGKLAAMSKLLRDRDAILKVSAMKHDVRQAFTICRLDRVIPLFDSVEKAQGE